METKESQTTSFCGEKEVRKPRDSFRKGKEHKYEMSNAEMLTILQDELEA